MSSQFGDTLPSSALTFVLGGRQFQLPSHSNRMAFWRKAEAGGWEEFTLRFVRDATDEHTIFIDIGAWIGPISLVASARAKKVIAIEPDPQFANELEELVALNGAPVEVWRVGINSTRGSLKLFKRTGFVASSIEDPSAEAINVPVVSFNDLTDAIANSFGRVVIKMDVEGHEFTLGKHLAAFAATHSAFANVSLHPAILYRANRRVTGALAARWQTFLATRTLIKGLRASGNVRLSKTGRRMTTLTLASFVFLRRRPKNFAVDLIPFHALPHP